MHGLCISRWGTAPLRYQHACILWGLILDDGEEPCKETKLKVYWSIQWENSFLFDGEEPCKETKMKLKGSIQGEGVPHNQTKGQERFNISMDACRPLSFQEAWRVGEAGIVQQTCIKEGRKTNQQRTDIETGSNNQSNEYNQPQQWRTEERLTIGLNGHWLNFRLGCRS